MRGRRARPRAWLPEYGHRGRVATSPPDLTRMTVDTHHRACSEGSEEGRRLRARLGQRRGSRRVSGLHEATSRRRLHKSPRHAGAWWSPPRSRVDRVGGAADTRSVGSIHSNRGFKRARIAREELGVGDDGPLPDALDVVEEEAAPRSSCSTWARGSPGHTWFARPALLFVNGRQGLTRQRFTLAHEFGHHRIGHATMIDRPSNLMDFGHEPLEVEANAFAAEFLMPRTAVGGLVRGPRVGIRHARARRATRRRIRRERSDGPVPASDLPRADRRSPPRQARSRRSRRMSTCCSRRISGSPTCKTGSPRPRSTCRASRPICATARSAGCLPASSTLRDSQLAPDRMWLRWSEC